MYEIDSASGCALKRAYAWCTLRRMLIYGCRDILFPELTTREHIVLVIGLKDVSPADPDTLVARYGLEEFAETKGSVLSGGQKRKLSLAMALVFIIYWRVLP